MLDDAKGKANNLDDQAAASGNDPIANTLHAVSVNGGLLINGNS